MYKIINEDFTLVKDYPAPEIYRTFSDSEKENIKIFKTEIDKLTTEKGLGKVSVNVSYDGPNIERAFALKYSNGYSYKHYYDEINKITMHMRDFSEKNNLYDFYLNSYIILK
ncbi:MAG: hypothetical protein IKV87_09495 [Methanobrevibacter sp.]|nr:hypothetical protein [Methanobrevibacter sp.]